MLTAKQADGTRVEAAKIKRGPIYVCPICDKSVALKQGKIRIAHFAHKPPVTCEAGRGESEAHLRAKQDFVDALRARGLTATPEQIVLSDAGDRRADVIVYHPKTNQPIALEIQHTSLEIEHIIRRTKGYMARQVPVLWIPILQTSRCSGARHLKHTNLVHVFSYSAAKWERWIHGYGFGHLWFYEPKGRAMWRGWMSSHYTYESGSEFYRDGEEHSFSGGWRTTKRNKTLHLEGPFKLDELRMIVSSRKEKNFGAYEYPAGPTVQLLAPYDDPKRAPKCLARLYPADVGKGRPELTLEILREGSWVAAEKGAPVNWLPIPQKTLPTSLGIHIPC